MLGGRAWRDRLREFTKAHEGLRLKPYTDTAGKLTIGYGRNLGDNGISAEEAEALYAHDEKRALRDAARLPYWRDLPDNWRLVVAAMLFQLGLPKFQAFRRMNAALAEGNYAAARREMMESKWARQDCPARARELHAIADDLPAEADDSASAKAGQDA